MLLSRDIAGFFVIGPSRELALLQMRLNLNNLELAPRTIANETQSQQPSVLRRRAANETQSQQARVGAPPMRGLPRAPGSLAGGPSPDCTHLTATRYKPLSHQQQTLAILATIG